MILAFTLDMPNVGSWNGKWSGEGAGYHLTRSFHGKQGIITATKLLTNSPFHYSWNDGWSTRINVREVKSNEAAKLRRKSCGFSGYDWMVTSLCKEIPIEDKPNIQTN